jgi:hypothetical protein
MSDERDLTPQQEARVARLLADARVEEPMPPDIAARLDRVLAGLTGEPVAPPVQHHAPVVDLAARRRRRVRNLLAAAAAVVVAGVGIGQLVDSQDSGDGAGTGTAQHDTDAGEGSEEDTLRADEAPTAAEHGEMDQGELRALGEPPRITTRSFAIEVRRLQDHAGVRTDAASGLMDGDDLAARGMSFTCDAADFGSGKLMAVRYNGSPAVLAYRPPSGQTQTVELLQCGSAEVLRSTTIPLP